MAPWLLQKDYNISLTRDDKKTYSDVVKKTAGITMMSRCSSVSDAHNGTNFYTSLSFQ